MSRFARRAAQDGQATVEPSDAHLVCAAIAGESAAREALFRRHYPRVLRLSYRLLGRADEAEDLAQDVCVDALRHLARVESPEMFEHWLTRVCVFKARSRLRRGRLLRRLGLGTQHVIDAERLVSPQTPPDMRAELQRIYERIHRLAPETRICLILRRVEGLQVDEIAALTERSPATVKRRIAEGVAAIDLWRRGLGGR